MNEIYKAIEHFEHLQKRYTTTHNGKHCEIVKTALTALREQAEREKGCEHCRGWDSRCGASYCPMCGKKLPVYAGTIGGEIVQHAMKEMEK